jgi:predicted RNA binding protein YcfA (HicA-like mRNA interferase family)
MKLARDISGQDLCASLSKIGYEITRQKGSHIRLSCKTKNGVHHITVPNHNPIKIGTLSAILSEIATTLGIDKNELIEKLR